MKVYVVMVTSALHIDGVLAGVYSDVNVAESRVRELRGDWRFYSAWIIETIVNKDLVV